jgi:hypothetical protein
MESTLKVLVLKIASSSRFQASPRLAALLQHLADAQESGKIVKEYSIGVDVLERPPDFDPRTDSIVRVHVSRLRKRLSEYYSEEGRNDSVRVVLPKGEYRFVLEAEEREQMGSAEAAVTNEPLGVSDPANIAASSDTALPSPSSGELPGSSGGLGRRAIHAGLVALLMAAIAVACLLLWRPTESAAVFVGTDVVTHGTWTGVYGADGQIIPNLVTKPPKYAEVDITGATTYTWWSKTRNLRALQHSAGASDRIASLFAPASNANKSFSITVRLKDGKWHQIALYLCDWDSGERDQTIWVSDPATNRVFDTRGYHNFENGRWVVWKVKGSVSFRIRTVDGADAAVNGIFFDGAPSNQVAAGGAIGLGPSSAPAAKAAGTDSSIAPGTAEYLGVDTATEGTWTGVYGADGQMIADHVNEPPGYALVTFPGALMSTWALVADDRRALQKASGSVLRIASRYHPATPSKVLSIRLELTDLKTHRIALYLCDWDNAGQVESVSVFNAVTHQLLDTRRYTALVNGKWSIWNIGGTVLIEVRSENGLSPSLNGIFFQ